MKQYSRLPEKNLREAKRIIYHLLEQLRRTRQRVEKLHQKDVQQTHQRQRQ